MAWGLRILGRKRFERHTERAARRFRPTMQRNFGLVMEDMTSWAKEKRFRGERTRAYRKGRPVTAPEGVLGIDTGMYRTSLSYETDHRGSNTRAEFGPVGIRYARVHEFGLGAMPKRPVVSPAIDEFNDEFFRVLGKTFRVL